MKTEDKLASALQSIEFIPSDRQRQAKAAFWSIASESPVFDPQGVSLSQVRQWVSDPEIVRWWPTPGFQDWFLNRDELRQRIEWAVHRGLDAVMDVFDDTEAPAMAKIRAFEIVSKLAGKEPAKRQVTEYADKDIQKMSEQELRNYLQKLGWGKDGEEQTAEVAEAHADKSTNRRDRLDS